MSRRWLGRTRPRLAAVIVPAALALAPALARTAAANDLTVTDCTDSGGGGSVGQLRRLMNDANAGDTIHVPACRIDLIGNAADDANLQGDLDVTKDLTIVGTGPGTVIAGGFNLMDRVLHVQPGVTAVVSDLVIRDGFWSLDGPGVYNQGTLTLVSVTITNNTTPTGAGGGLDNTGTVTLDGCQVSGNTAESEGGGIVNHGTATISRTPIVQNIAGDAGGVFSDGPFLHLDQSTVSGNYANSGFGGGLRNHDPGTLIITASTVSGNSAYYGGGGIANSGALIVTNSTISGNSATRFDATGGGIWNSDFGGGPASVSLTRVTLTANTNNGPSPSSALVHSGAAVSGIVEGSIITGTCVGGGVNASSGHNIDSTNICFNAVGTDQVNVADVKLGPLQDNGGPTQTHLPADDSPAVDMGGATCSPATDQRGVARPYGAACDVGAVEANDLIFQDDFESGNPSAWSLVADDGGDLSVSPAAALGNSANGLQAVVNDTSPLYVEDFTPSSETRYRARFYFDPQGFDPGEAMNHFRIRIFLMFDDSGTKRLSALVLKRQGGNYSLMQRCRRDDNSQYDTGFFPISDSPHWVLVEWRHATTPTSADGMCALTVDGTTLATLSDVQNNARTVGAVRMGTMNVKAGAAGTLFFDEFVSRRTGPIPPNP